MDSPPVWADFNGLFGDVLCLTHEERAQGEDGSRIELREGMRILAFDLDANDEGKSDKIIATGIVARPPEWLTHKGSRWVLLIEERGVRHESDEKADNSES